jgi:hypothetical protein
VPHDTPEVKRRTHRQTSLASGEASRSGQACVRFGADNGSALVPLLTVCCPSLDCVLGRDNKIGLFPGLFDGSDGTRTRDLRRDRPVLWFRAEREWAGITGESRAFSSLRCGDSRGLAGTSGALLRYLCGMECVRDGMLPKMSTSATREIGDCTQIGLRSRRPQARGRWPRRASRLASSPEVGKRVPRVR